jgi:hypothetical protein
MVQLPEGFDWQLHAEHRWTMRNTVRHFADNAVHSTCTVLKTPRFTQAWIMISHQA